MLVDRSVMGMPGINNSAYYTFYNRDVFAAGKEGPCIIALRLCSLFC